MRELGPDDESCVSLKRACPFTSARNGPPFATQKHHPKFGKLKALALFRSNFDSSDLGSSHFDHCTPPWLPFALRAMARLTAVLVAVTLGRAVGGAVDLTSANYDAEVVNSGKNAFVKFLAPW